MVEWKAENPLKTSRMKIVLGALAFATFCGVAASQKFEVAKVGDIIMADIDDEYVKKVYSMNLDCVDGWRKVPGWTYIDTLADGFHIGYPDKEMKVKDECVANPTCRGVTCLNSMKGYSSRDYPDGTCTARKGSPHTSG